MQPALPQQRQPPPPLPPRIRRPPQNHNLPPPQILPNHIRRPAHIRHVRITILRQRRRHTNDQRIALPQPRKIRRRLKLLPLHQPRNELPRNRFDITLPPHQLPHLHFIHIKSHATQPPIRKRPHQRQPHIPQPQHPHHRPPRLDLPHQLVNHPHFPNYFCQNRHYRSS